MNWTPEELNIARDAHHEAGHAVAVVATDNTLTRVGLLTDEASARGNIHGATEHRTAWKDQPFVTFAGPWAEAKWLLENQIYGHSSLEQALPRAWERQIGDIEKYEERITLFGEFAILFGFPLTDDRYWEAQWLDKLEPLWPAVREVAHWLINRQAVTHDMVAEALAPSARP